MAAPTPVVRTAPTGKRLKNGYRVSIGFSTNLTVKLWEISIKPPGIDGGDSINVTTQWESTWEAHAARALKRMTDGTFKFGYDPAFWSSIVALVNVEQTITLGLPNGGTLTFYGYAKSFEFDELQNGTMPTGTGAFVATNYDPVNDVAADPVYTPPV
jgi:hypothetical protein